MSRATRRDLLKATAGVSLAAPLLGSLTPTTARAQTVTYPTRLLVFFQPNGHNPGDWFPTPGNSATEFTLNQTMAPLAPHRNDLIITSGIDMRSLELGPGEPHQRGMGAVLSGTHLQEGSFVGGDGTLAGWGNGISVDQHVANHIGGGTRLKSLELGIRATGAEVRTRINYAGPAQPIPPENTPRRAHSRIFGDFTVAPSEQAQITTRRRSVLDGARRQFALLRSKVGAADRAKLDVHEALVRDIETRLDATGVSPSACEIPPQPPFFWDATDEDRMDEVSRLQIDLMVMAMACDITRVGTLQYSTGANNIRFPHVDNYGDDHQLSHAADTDAASQAWWATRHRWYAEEFAYLLQQMKNIPEGDGTLLDNTLIFWCNELAQGNTHSHANMPFVLAGGAGGRVQTGRFLQYGGANHNDLLVSIMNACGVEGTTFGDPNYCTGPLAGITA
jgi:hypothetical protein